MATRMQQRRGTGTQWTTANPVLAAGEIGFETDTNQFKMGDGVNVWSSLTYFIDTTALSTSLGDYVTLASAGAANGVATLDASGFVPAAQLNIDLTPYYTSSEVDTEISTAVSGLIDSAPGALDTLNELAAAIGDNADFITTINTSIGLKQDKVAGVTDTEIGYLDGVTSAIQGQIDTKQEIVSGVDSTEIAYLNGVTSAIQTQIDTKKTQTTVSLSSDVTLDVNVRYLVDTSSVRSLTLPAAPSVGDEIQIFDASNNAGTNNITVNNNSLNINGAVDTLNIDVDGAVAYLVYTGSTLGWRI